jgi:hypothetical protein
VVDQLLKWFLNKQFYISSTCTQKLDPHQNEFKPLIIFIYLFLSCVQRIYFICIYAVY